MKKTKKILSVVLSMLLVVSSMVCGTVIASDAAGFSEGDLVLYKYVVQTDSIIEAFEGSVSYPSDSLKISSDGDITLYDGKTGSCEAYDYAAVPGTVNFNASNSSPAFNFTKDAAMIQILFEVTNANFNPADISTTLVNIYDDDGHKNNTNNPYNYKNVIDDLAGNEEVISGGHVDIDKGESYTTAPTEPETTEYVAPTDVIYFDYRVSGGHAFGEYDTPFTNNDDGTYTLSIPYTGVNTACSLYNETKGKFYTVSALTSVPLQLGAAQADLSLVEKDSRTSLIFSGAATGVLVLTYDYDNMTLTYELKAAEPVPTESEPTEPSTQPETTEPTEPVPTQSETTESTEPVADTVTLYCECNQSWWTTDGAAVGVHYWGGSDKTTYPGVKGTPVDGKDGLWKFEVPADSTGIIFTRMGNSGDQDGKDWGAKTANLTIPTDGTNLYTITSKDPVWGDPGVEGEWSVYDIPIATEATTEATEATTEATEATTEATEATTVETTEATEPSTTEPVADTVTLYCECNQSWWTTDGAAVGVHYWGGSDKTTYPGVKGTPVDGKDGLWKFEVPADSTGIIFTRMGNSGDQDGKDWGAKTADLTIPTDGTNLYTITSKDPVWGDPGVEGEWSVYGAPVETEYTVVYSYTTNDGEQKLTKTVKTAETDAAAIASLAVPEIVNPYATYDLGECTLDGTTVNAAMVATEKKYTVTVDGVTAGTYGYKEKATVKLNGADYTFYVTGDVDLVSGEEKTSAAISLDGLTVSDDKVSMELLATANVENFARMGVVFATSEKSQADIEAAVAAVTTGTKVSNGIAVHNSSVDTPNESGSYQFTYAPFVNKDKANKTLYFYTFAVDTNGTVSVSSVAKVDLANAYA